jgi:hypothetical protein
MLLLWQVTCSFKGRARRSGEAFGVETVRDRGIDTDRSSTIIRQQ